MHPAIRLVEGLGRLIRVRDGERRSVLISFSVLLLTVAAHALLETARDALLLSGVPRGALGIVYILIAVLTVPAALASRRATVLLGSKRALTVSLAAASVLVAGAWTLPSSSVVAVVVYVLTGLIGAVLVPQFWSFMGDVFTATQVRRLFGPISSAGVIGGVAGSLAAMAVVRVAPSGHLLLLAAAVLLVAGAVLSVHRPMAEIVARVAPVEHSETGFSGLVAEPFVRRLAGLVALSTATLLAVDYLFKWSVAEAVPREQLGRYLSSYYAAMNGASLVMQLVVGGALVRKLGVGWAAVATPLLLTMSAVVMVAAGGAPRTVLVAKGIDGATRHSVHRLTLELLYLPIPTETRARLKPLIDGPVARGAQAATACLVLILAATGRLSRGRLGALVLALAIAWLVLAASSHKRYLEVFRNALARPPGLEPGLLSVDFATAEMLVERLAATDPDEVVRSAGVLARRGRSRLVPALLLYHPSSRVLRFALELFADGDRTDWIPLAAPLLSHESEGVRMAAVRALARSADIALLSTLAQREGPRMRGYAAVWQAVRGAAPDARVRLAGLVEEAERGPNGPLRSGILEAIADAPRDAQLGEAVLRLVDDNEPRPAVTPANMGGPADVLARAIARQGDERLVPLLVQRLVTRVGREEVRDALVKLGEPAFRALVVALDSSASSRPLRVHIPRSIARFASAQAAEVLLRVVESDLDGLVRYKALRGLGRMVAENHLHVEPRRATVLAERNAREYLRLFAALNGLRTDYPADDVRARRAGATLRLLEGLLDDKMRQAMERAFRLLKIAHPTEDLQALHGLAQSTDRHASARAHEFIDALLTRRYERGLRKALQTALEPMTNRERVRLSRDLFGAETPPQQYQAALLYLVGDGDAFVSDIAVEHVSSLGDETLLHAASAAKRGGGGPERGQGRSRLVRLARA